MPPQLLADVSEFMDAAPGDVLMLGCDCLADGTRPLVHAGDTVEITAPGFAPTRHNFVKEVTA
jgi:5-oxopent-3-ene-1,2,5-tricarboxylate decarboxylase/2-hydroxyhepta-2,4-diene-1,7-dioate isomerase